MRNADEGDEGQSVCMYALMHVCTYTCGYDEGEEEKV